jgi:hypothetical protein
VLEKVYSHLNTPVPQNLYKLKFPLLLVGTVDTSSALTRSAIEEIAAIIHKLVTILRISGLTPICVSGGLSKLADANTER